jgi:integrase
MLGITTTDAAEAARKEIAQRCIDGTLPRLSELIAGKKTFAIESAVLAEAGMTVCQYATDLWLRSPTRTKLAAHDDNESALRVHVFSTPVSYRNAPVPFGDIPILQVQSEHLVELVYALDQRVIERRSTARQFSEKRAINVWSAVTQLFQDAHTSKDPKLKVLRANPCIGVRGPDPGAEKAKVFIYPNELLKLLRCSLVPIEWRRFYAIGVYAYMRVSEMRCIDAPDIDVEHRRVHIHKRMDRKGQLHYLKGKRARYIPMEPHSVPVWRSLIQMAPTGPVFAHIDGLDDGKKLAATLRMHMALSAITREELFVGQETRRKMRYHDLRATGITWMAFRGDNAVLIMHRSSHRDYATMLQYVREAENLRDTNFGQVFPPLPSELGIPADDRPGPPPREGPNGATGQPFEPPPSSYLHTSLAAPISARVSAGAPKSGVDSSPIRPDDLGNSRDSLEIGGSNQVRVPAPPLNI